MPDFTVIRVGTDSSGRGLYYTSFFWQVLQAIKRDRRVAPFAAKITHVQGGFMTRNGGGAVDSAGYHNEGGADDIRTWNLTADELKTYIWVAALYALIYWPRDQAHGGMDPHAHACAGWDRPISPGIAYQWQQARNRRDGLASNGPDYVHPRPAWVNFPPADLLQEDYLMTDQAKQQLEHIEDQNERIIGLLQASQTADQKRWTNERQSDRDAAKKAKAVAGRQIALLGGVVDRLGSLAKQKDLKAVQSELADLRASVLAHLAADPDVDGPENPAK